MICCLHLFPDTPICRNYKTKETDIVQRVRAQFPLYTWISDRRVSDGCSVRRPDLLCDFGTHIIIVEVDEHQHRDYDTTCENKRIMELSHDVGYRPIVFLRFNPDAYVNANGVSIPSPWGLNKLGVMTIKKKREREWDERIQNLFTKIEFFSQNCPTKMIEIVQLFY